MRTHKEVLAKALSNPEVRREYEALEPEYQLCRALIQLRKQLSMTQEQVAELLGTKQEYISRIEQGDVGMTFSYLARLMRVMGADMEIVLYPRGGREPVRTRIAVR